MAISSANDLHLVPLGAGDLIDRAIRLYRRHLLTLMRIAAPPVIISAIGSVMWTVGKREIFITSSTGALVFYGLLMAAAACVFVGGHMFSLIVMGGASRNLVTHLLWNEPVLVRTTYAAVRSRFWSLFGATIVIAIWLVISAMVGFFGAYVILTVMGFALMGLALTGLGQVAPVWLLVVFGGIGTLVATAVFLWWFFFLAGKVAYVPQVLLVEGTRVFEAVGRSFSLAKGNVRRLTAMTFFITFATYSALMLLIMPLSWYGYVSGIDPSPFSGVPWPTWYAIAHSVIWPLSSILLTPVWMLAMSLLYVDERVRQEGYDIELMASQKLPPMPRLDVTSPFAPAISTGPTRLPLQRPAHAGSVLGLNKV